MSKAERKIIEFVESNIEVIFCILITLCAILIRISLMDLRSEDMRLYLIPWYNEIKANGGIRALGTQVGNYNMLYQFLIAVMTYFPIKEMYAYKILSIIFDFVLALCVGKIVSYISNGEKNRARVNGVLGYAAVLMLPMVLLNSSFWGQCDAIYTAFVMLSILALIKEKNVLSFVFLGIAFAFKLQAIFILPLYIFIYFYSKKFSIINFVIIPVAMVILSLPSIIMGRKISDIFGVYVGQADLDKVFTFCYPNVWGVVTKNQAQYDNYSAIKFAGIIIAAVIIFSFMFVWINKKIKLSPVNILCMAYTLASTCVMFLPAMHERYGFLSEIILLILAIKNKKLMPFAFVSYLIITICYFKYLLYGVFEYFELLSILNIIIYMIIIFIINNKLIKDN